MKKQMLLVLVLASAGLSAGAYAQSATANTPAASAQRPMHGMRLDSNGDGMISRDEAASAPRLADKFDQIDTNKDGKLSSDEMKAWRAQHGRRGAAGGDMADGAMGDRHGACFDKADTDKNGQLSREEFANLRQACGGMMHGGARHGGAAAAGTSPPATTTGSQAPAR